MLVTPTVAPIEHHDLAELARVTRPDDCAQDVLLSALAKPPALRTSLGAWFQGARRLRALETARSEGSRRSRELRVARPESTDDATRELELSELREHLQLGLTELEPATRAILRAHYWEGLTLTAIADRRGSSLGSVKRRHAAGLAHLRQRLGDPTTGRRDWGTLAWALAAAAGLLLAGLLAPSGRGLGPGHSAPDSVKMTALVPSQLVASAAPLPLARAIPATPTSPSRSATELKTASVPATRLTPAEPVRPQLDRASVGDVPRVN